MTDLPVFIVASTGRCGSTLLSDMLDAHPQVLSLSEFLVPLVLSGLRRADQLMTAEQFCAVLQTHMPTTTALLRVGLTVPEFRYPFHRPGARYGTQSGLPFPLNGALAHLTDDPDTAFDNLLAHIMAHGGTCAGEHLALTFRTLADMFGGFVVVERSGGSMLLTAQIKALLPQASFILLTRSGIDTALSMQRHAYFRHIALRSIFMARLGYDPYTSSRRDGIDALPTMLVSQLPERFSKEGFDALTLPANIFGAIWAHHTERGLYALPDCFHHLTYRDLCSDPRSQLLALADYIGASRDALWTDCAARMVATPSRKMETLPDHELALLQAAVEPGAAALALKGIY
jgi:hypothetical protein